MSNNINFYTDTSDGFAITVSRSDGEIFAMFFRKEAISLRKMVDGSWQNLNVASNLLSVASFASQYTANANATAQVNFTPTLAGYKPIGIVGYTTGNGNVVIQQCRFIDATTLRAYPRNLSSTQVTANFTVDVLFVKE